MLLYLQNLYSDDGSATEINLQIKLNTYLKSSCDIFQTQKYESGSICGTTYSQI